VTSAWVSNATYDDIYVNNTIGTPARLVFVGGQWGKPGGNGNAQQRFAVYAKANYNTYIGGELQSPIYEQLRTHTIVGGRVPDYSPEAYTIEGFYASRFPWSAQTVGRTQIVSPQGRDIVLALRDTLGNGTGTVGNVEVRRYDAARNRIFQVPGLLPVNA